MKKIFVYILVGILSFSVVFSNYYKSAHAMDWVSGALSFAETLTWVLASLGITCTVSDYSAEVDKTRAEFWESYEQDFYNYVNEHEGNTSSDRFIAWKNKLCEGVLDKSSEYWDLFKSWASSLTSGSSSGGSVSPVTFSDYVTYVNQTYGFNYTIPASYQNSIVYGSIIGTNSSKTTVWCHYVFLDYAEFNLIKKINTYYINFSDSVFGLKSSSTSGALSNSQTFSGDVSLLYSDDIRNFELFNINVDQNVTSYPLNVMDLGVVSVDSDFDSVSSDIDNLDVISSDGVDEDDPEVTLPYPGVSDSDDTISSDIYQDIIDAINDGTITQEEGVERIHEILKVITYDTVTDKVVPPQKDPDTGEDKTKDEVLKENKENMGFTLAGLENVFPFCIPFDIYAFMTLLVAEPEAPEIDFPIQSINGEVEEIHIDLSPFDSVAVVVRYIFDFLFIIGLGILTRSLIGGGSSD